MSEEKSCDYIKDSNEPCKDCPRLITALYRCEILKETAKDKTI
jgi:hypothetical protein